MNLSPQERDKLVLHQAGFLAQKRLARGCLLNYPEAVALIASQILEFIRDGHSVAELMQMGRLLLGRNDVMTGVPEMIQEIQVEGTFPDGSKLVTVHDPIVNDHGDHDLALYGSFLPNPGKKLQAHSSPIVPGELFIKTGEIEINQGRKAITLEVIHKGDRPIQVGSHYHFAETNSALDFHRNLARGMRLDIPAGTAVRFEPGEKKTISLTEIAGKKIIKGGRNLMNGKVETKNVP